MSIAKKLVRACIRGDLNSLKLLLAIKVKSLDRIMRIACRMNHLHIIKYLIERKYNVNLDTVYVACYMDRLEVVKYMLEHVRKSYSREYYLNMVNEVLIETCRYGHLDIIEYLTGLGADKFSAAFLTACEMSRLDVIKYTMTQIDKIELKNDLVEVLNTFESGLKIACSYGHIDVVKYLVDEYYVVNLNSGLSEACYEGYLEIAKFLVEKGADDFKSGFKVACRGHECNTFNYEINTIMYMYECLEFTEDTKSDDIIDILNEGLYYSINNNLEMTKYLIEKGANNIHKMYIEDVPKLLNIGLEPKLLGYKSNNFIKRREEKNEKIKRQILVNTTICADAIRVICSYTEY